MLVLLILQVVRCFEDNDIVHVNGKVDPKSDADVINLELVFSDLDQVNYNKNLFLVFQVQLKAKQENKIYLYVHLIFIII